MRESKTITATLDEDLTAYTETLFQYDVGIVLKIEGVTLPDAYEVHFANKERGGESLTSIGNADGVLIPDAVLQTGKPVYAFLYLHEEATDGWTVARITIPVYARPAITDQEPEPSEASVIAQAIEALNEAMAEVKAVPKWNIYMTDDDLIIEEVE